MFGHVDNSFVYLDPPYRGGFADYNTKKDDAFQETVVEFFENCKEKGSYCLLSNRDLGDAFFASRKGANKIVYFDVTYTVGRKKKNEDGFGSGWSSKQKKVRNYSDWDNFDADAEMDLIEDEDRRSRGLNDVEIRNEKILEIMQNHDLSEAEKMESCMGIAGHQGYKHELSEEDKARNEAQELLNKIQDPRYQSREKMHYMQEAYEKFQGEEGLANLTKKKDVAPEKLAEMQKMMAGMSNPIIDRADSHRQSDCQ